MLLLSFVVVVSFCTNKLCVCRSEFDNYVRAVHDSLAKQFPTQEIKVRLLCIFCFALICLATYVVIEDLRATHLRAYPLRGADNDDSDENGNGNVKCEM